MSDLSKTTPKDNRTKHELYDTWYHMKRRCYTKSCKEYPNYGNRGIVVCERWLSSFWDFVSDMGDKPTPKHSIDRINNDGNYEPSNCRWATTKEQARNTSYNVYFNYDGKNMCLVDWAEHLGVRVDTLSRRHRRGLSIDKMLVKKIHSNPHGWYLNDKWYNCGELGKIYGFDRRVMSRRYKLGWSVERAITEPTDSGFRKRKK